MHLTNSIKSSTFKLLIKRLIKRFFVEAKQWSWLWLLLIIQIAAQAQNCPTADFEFSNTCLTQYTQFTSTSFNVAAGTTYQWDFDNDQSYDLETTENVAFWEFPETGIYTVSLNIVAPDSCTSNSKKYFLEILECENCLVKSTVPNNSFETTNTCPENLGEINATEKWFSANGGSPDLFSSCSENWETNTINNIYGTQMIDAGNSYAGIVAYHKNETREYIAVELEDALSIGNLYCISYKVSLAESSRHAIAEMGAYFSTNQIIDPANVGRLTSKPQFENKLILNDTENWITINSNFIADQPYKFLTIGNFSDNTTSLVMSGSIDYAYYYIDDVVVTSFIANVEPGTEICPGEKVNLTAESEGLCETFWTTSNEPNTILSIQQKFSVAPTKKTSYIFNARNECCLFQDTITIHVKEVIVADAGLDATVCEGEATSLSIAGSTDFNWSPQAGIVNPNSATTEVIPFETTTYTLMITNQNGCQSTDEIVITVIDRPKVEVTSALAFYPDEPVQLLALSNENNQYQWSPETGLNNPNIPNPTAAPELTTIYTVKVTNENNCTTLAYTTVELKECEGYANAGKDRSICEGEAIPLKASGGLKYVWTPPEGLDAPDVFNPIARPTKTTTYKVTATNFVGCSFKDEITINVAPKPQLTVMEVVNLSAGETATLSATGSGQFYNWQPSTGLSNSAIPNPVFSGSVTTTYTVFNFNLVTDICKASAKIKVNVLDTVLINMSEENVITDVIDVLEDCSFGQKPVIYHTQNSKPKSESSINKIEQLKGAVLKIYPLPANNFIHVVLGLVEFEDKTGMIQISNLNGQVILQEQIKLLNGLQQHRISTKNLAKGLYFLSFQNNDIFMTEKFIKD